MLKKIILGSLFCTLALNAMAGEKIYQGLGSTSNFRVGPGKDSKGVQVYSFNHVIAAGLFDEDGKILNLDVDILELSTPNYDGETMPHFSGWPGTSGYNVTDHATKEVVGISDNTVENATEEVKEWKTKRERGEKYGMNPKNEWYKQMDNFEEYFKGKTVDELEKWFAKYTSDVNGRPLRDGSPNEKDKEKYAKLNEMEKKELTDLTAGATMSIRDSHGDILTAIKKAYENRSEVKK